jgi:hypothetical protein
MGNDEEMLSFLKGEDYQETQPQEEINPQPQVQQQQSSPQQPIYQPTPSLPPSESLTLRQNPMVLLYRLQEACAEHAADGKLFDLLVDAKAFVDKSLHPPQPPQIYRKEKKGFFK